MTTDEMLADESIGTVVIATSHDTHAALAARALRAGKHVFSEKPLAVTEEELDDVELAWRESGRRLQVGFNRRHSPWVAKANTALGDAGGSLMIIYRVNAGALPESHWYHDRRQGGRLLGEGLPLHRYLQCDRPTSAYWCHRKRRWAARSVAPK